MAALLLTTASSLSCPHGGTVVIASSNSKALAGAPLALAADTFTIAGCPFQIPIGTGTVPHPCIRVQWSKTNGKVMVGGVPTLAMDSVGLCLAADQAPQGNVVIASTQTRASGS